MYNENKFVIYVSSCETGSVFRKDDKRSSASTSHALRSGRDVDMLKYTGLIYEHVALRLQNLHFEINMFDRGMTCTHAAITRALCIYGNLKMISPFLKKRHVQYKNEKKGGKPLLKGHGWTELWYERGKFGVISSPHSLLKGFLRHDQRWKSRIEGARQVYVKLDAYFPQSSCIQFVQL
jgi:hypothetical protein